MSRGLLKNTEGSPTCATPCPDYPSLRLRICSCCGHSLRWGIYGWRSKTAGTGGGPVPLGRDGPCGPVGVLFTAVAFGLAFGGPGRNGGVLVPSRIRCGGGGGLGGLGTFTPLGYCGTRSAYQPPRHGLLDRSRAGTVAEEDGSPIPMRGGAFDGLGTADRERDGVFGAGMPAFGTGVPGAGVLSPAMYGVGVPAAGPKREGPGVPGAGREGPGVPGAGREGPGVPGAGREKPAAPPLMPGPCGSYPPNGWSMSEPPVRSMNPGSFGCCSGHSHDGPINSEAFIAVIAKLSAFFAALAATSAPELLFDTG